MSYAGLGFRQVVGVPDTTGNNAGNWTCVIDPQVIAANVPYFEVYHLYVSAPTLADVETTIQIALNQGLWDYNLLGNANGWDPAQPLIMTPGDTLYGYFNVPTDTTPAPIMTAWFRYDLAFNGGVPLG